MFTISVVEDVPRQQSADSYTPPTTKCTEIVRDILYIESRDGNKLYYETRETSGEVSGENRSLVVTTYQEPDPERT